MCTLTVDTAIVKLLRFTPMALRANVAAKIDGGYSAALAALLRRLLIGPHGVMTVGMPVSLRNGRQYTIWAVLKNILADGEGFEVGYQWRGASRLRPCLKHWNVLALRSNLAVHDDTATYVEIDCADAARFRCRTREDMVSSAREAVDVRRRHHAGEVNQTSFNKTLQHLGFNATASDLLVDAQLLDVAKLDFVSVITYDWMHTFLQGGVLTDEVFALITRCKHLGCSAEALRRFMQSDGWRFPRWRHSKSRLAAEVFNPKRSPETKIKAGASELLNAYGQIRYFVEAHIPLDHPSVAKEKASFLACCKVVDLILEAKKADDAARYAEPLQRQLEQFFRLHKAAYQDVLLKPKHHWAMDLPEQLLRDDAIFDAFALERLHLRAKRIAQNVRNCGSNMEIAILEGVLAQQIQKINAGDLANGLRGREEILADFADTVTAPGLHWNGLLVSSGDLIFEGGILGEVVAAARRRGQPPYIIVQLLEHVERVTPHCSTWRSTDEVAMFFSISSLRFPQMWKHEEGGVVRVVV